MTVILKFLKATMLIGQISYLYDIFVLLNGTKEQYVRYFLYSYIVINFKCLDRPGRVLQ